MLQSHQGSWEVYSDRGTLRGDLAVGSHEPNKPHSADRRLLLWGPVRSKAGTFKLQALTKRYA